MSLWALSINYYFGLSHKWCIDSFLPFTFPISLSNPYLPQRKMLGEMCSQLHCICLDLNLLCLAEIFLNHMRAERDPVETKYDGKKVELWLINALRICMDLRYRVVSRFNVFIMPIKSTFMYLFNALYRVKIIYKSKKKKKKKLL